MIDSMRPAWRLAISSVSRRASRTILLVLVVALSATLVSSVGTAMGSLRHAVESRVTGLVGRADLRVKARGTGNTLPTSLVTTLRTAPGVAAVAPRLESSLSLRFGRPVWARANDVLDGPYSRSIQTFQVTSRITGIDPPADAMLREIKLDAGRLPGAANEITIDGTLAKRLSETNSKPIIGQLGLSLLARSSGASGKSTPGPESAATKQAANALNSASGPAPGDTLELVRFGKMPVTLTIVGIAAPPPLGAQPYAYMTIDALASLTDQQGRASRIDVVLNKGVDHETFAKDFEKVAPREALIQTAERLTSGLDKGVRANQMGFLFGNLMAILAAGFIITTGLSTAVSERQRELAVLRCIGASRAHLALSQLFMGGLIGLAGAIIGVPIGVALAFAMLRHYRDKLQADPVILPESFIIPVIASVVAGVLGAALPAWQATRVSPLKALASRSRPASPTTIRAITIAGLLCVLIHVANFTILKDPDAMFWAYVALGLPALMIGYFLLGVPGTLLASRCVAPLLEKILKIPAGLLSRSVRTTPFRFGFTAGAMMCGLALMVAVWTQGGSALRDWVGRIRFPDGFAVGLNLSPEALSELKKLPFVTDACAIALHPVETEAFGIKGVGPVKTFFVAFDPEPFFRMTTVEWIQGNESAAREGLLRGGSVIVTNEFLIARGMGVGSTFTCKDSNDATHSFNVVGVVRSPGLEMANSFFDVDEDFTEQRAHSVFGSRQDLLDKFGSSAVGLIQFNLKEDADDVQALATVRETLLPFGVLNAGSGRQIKELVTGFMKTAFKIVSGIAIFSMGIASFGVANLVIAGIQARQFEFGVMRAVGGSSSLLTRLVLAEALLIAIVACVLGTVMGLQGAWGGSALDSAIWGLDLHPSPPIVPILLGWCFLIAICFLAALPAALSLSKKRPRELLAAMRG